MCCPDVIAPVLDAVAALTSATPIVLIDGPSGAGKSTLADRLIDAWSGATRPTLVRMDDIYPGWDGLDAGSEQVVTELLGPLRRIGRGRWQRYDWATRAPAEWHPVDDTAPIVIEGCGSISRASAPLADLRVWITADDVVRKRRALRRDHGGFDAHWDAWQASFDAFVAREAPVGLADLVLDATPRFPPVGARRVYGGDMSTQQPADPEYIVEYIDGPLAGGTERRYLVRGKYDDEVTAVAAVEGLESQFAYNAVDTREINGQLHVRYRFDAPDSDPVEPDVDDNRDAR